MKDGLYLEIGDQLVFKNYSNAFDDTSINDDTFRDKEVVWFYPDFNAVYKMDKLAFFGAFAVAGGGGTLNYKDGTAATWGLFAKQAASYKKTAQQLSATIAATPTLAGTLGPKAQAAGAAATNFLAIANKHSLEVYSVTYGETLGLSLQVNDMFSVAAAARLLQSQQNLTLSSSNAFWKTQNGGSDAGYEAFGMGVGGIFGVHAKPIDALDIAVQYKTITKMNVEFKSMEGKLASTLLSGAEKGDHYYNDMPPELNVGLGYQVLNPLYVNTSFNYYFNDQARISNALAKSDKMKYKNSWELGGGLDWQITDRLLASTGLMYSDQGSNSKANNLFAPVLDCVNIGLGIEVKATNWLTVTAGGVYAKYFEKEYNTMGYDFDLNKDVTLFSLGLTFKPL